MCRSEGREEGMVDTSWNTEIPFCLYGVAYGIELTRLSNSQNKVFPES